MSRISLPMPAMLRFSTLDAQKRWRNVNAKSAKVAKSNTQPFEKARSLSKAHGDFRVVGRNSRGPRA